MSQKRGLQNKNSHKMRAIKWKLSQNRRFFFKPVDLIQEILAAIGSHWPSRQIGKVAGTSFLDTLGAHG